MISQTFKFIPKKGHVTFICLFVYSLWRKSFKLRKLHDFKLQTTDRGDRGSLWCSCTLMMASGRSSKKRDEIFCTKKVMCMQCTFHYYFVCLADMVAVLFTGVLGQLKLWILQPSQPWQHINTKALFSIEYIGAVLFHYSNPFRNTNTINTSVHIRTLCKYVRGDLQ